MRKVLRGVVCAAIVCLCLYGRISVAETDVAARIAQLYTNPQVIDALRRGEIPEGLVQEIWSPLDIDSFWSYQCKTDRMGWFVSRPDSAEPYPANGSLLLLMQDRINAEGATFDLEYDPRFVNDAFIGYHDTKEEWVLRVPAEQSAAMLAEFVTLAADTASPLSSYVEALDVETDAQRQALFQSHIESWREKFPLSYASLNSAMYNPYLIGDYDEGLFTADLGSSEFSLTAAQFEAVYATCRPLSRGNGQSAMEEPLRAMKVVPTRIESLSAYSPTWTGSFMLYDGDLSDMPWLCYANDDTDIRRYVDLTQAQFDALAAACWPLSPAERIAPMKKLYDELATPPHSVQERIDALYTNPDSAESLCRDIQPAGWEDVLDNYTGDDDHTVFLCEEDALQWQLSFETDTSGRFKRLRSSILSLHVPEEDTYAYLNFTMGEMLCNGDAKFSYEMDGEFGEVTIPAAQCKKILTEFATLAVVCAQPLDLLDETALDERKDSVANFVTRCKASFPVTRIGLNLEYFTKILEADLLEQRYWLYTYGDGPSLAYTLTAEQFEAAFDSCAAVPWNARDAWATGYALALKQAPARVLYLRYGKAPYSLTGDYALGRFLLHTRDEYDNELDRRFLTLEQYEALAAECLPLSPEECIARLAKAFDEADANYLPFGEEPWY